MEAMNRELKDELKEYVLAEGADLFGVASEARYAGAPAMLKPAAHLPEAKSVISIAVHHPDACVEWGGEPNPNYPGPFQIGMIPKLDTISLRVARFLEKKGYAAVPFGCTFYWRHRRYKSVPYDHAGTFSHMSAFVAAGLGEYGRHGMVMSPEYGPRQRLVSVLTSAELPPDPLYAGESLCDGCGLCEKHCPGKNYEKDRLLNPPYIEFEIEGKLFKYPNINRWRCFYGEQAHLDMERLADMSEMDENGIYNSLEEGVKRVEGKGAAGYCCASFKYCMSKPVRKWDRKYTPGPRRLIRSENPKTEDLWSAVESIAKRAGADKIAVRPLSEFEDCKDNFHDGFRTEEWFRHFDTVITLGRKMPDFSDLAGLDKKNKGILDTVQRGRLMMAIMDISRMLDDQGIDSTQDWSVTGISRKAAGLAGWGVGPEVMVESVVCRCDFKAKQTEIDLFSHGRRDGGIDKSLPFLGQIDKIGVVSLDKIDLPEISRLREGRKRFKSLVVLLMGMPARVVELAGRQESEDGTSYAFVNYQIVRETLSAAHDLAGWLEARGYCSVPLAEISADSFGTLSSSVGPKIPGLRANAPFAAAAGLGEIGLSGMLLTPEFGPRQRFSFVLTDAELPETEKYQGTRLCPEGCRRCAQACPANALSPDRKLPASISQNERRRVFERNEARCAWARTLGMVEGEGSGLLGWKLPDMPVPDELTAEIMKKALAGKDPIQRICYGNPNHSDLVIERCLQACPAGSR